MYVAINEINNNKSVFGFRTNYEFISKAAMRSIIKETKINQKQKS